MNARTTRGAAVRRAALAAGAAVSAVCLTACGAFTDTAEADGSAPPAKSGDITVGLLLPDRDTTRFEKFDRPVFTRRIASLTAHRGRVRYANAGASAARQSRQLQQMIDAKVDVVVVDAVDGRAIAPQVRKAREAGIPVIAYDRLAEGPIDAYVSHDNELVGEVQGRALLEALGSKAPTSRIVMLNGSPTDPNSALFEKGALDQLKNSVVIAKSYDTRAWLPQVAEANLKKAIRSVGLGNIAAVYAANDGLAGAAVKALKQAGATRIPPVTGQDADLAAVRRIVAGEQYMTVYKSFTEEADNAAEMAVAKAQGRSLAFDALARDKVGNTTRKDIPAALVPVVAVTRDTVKDTLVRDGVYTVRDICTPAYAADCAAIGLN
ncbi:sugar ABC transporter substrate-binding protein [Streptomyces echinoruber]|uniref:Solute-binding protein n=1 Tax=Streptomyces echinoruber TaxID=68898 RepID=A0A918VE54_9ACTN|nr:substrate-binding domain-containing protein [Streptomyces echinoruber]GGZ90165.1 solute-binding protein [Streptomyces echinoruber]